jgi:ubiquinone/menaquinone biosynthesis C-methylase UbiE
LLKRVKPEEFRDWNEEMVKKYDPDAFHHHSNFLVRFVEGRRVKVIFELMTSYQGSSILEIGCGAGNVIEKAPDGPLFGIDLSSYLLRKAKNRLNRRTHLVQGDALMLPYKDLSFMRVICSEVLEHVLDPLSALHEISRILKPRGMAIVSVPNESLINQIKTSLIRLGVYQWFLQQKGDYREMPERMEDEWHLHNFKLDDWLHLFRKYFRVTRLRRIPFFWLPLRYVLRLEKRG